MSRNAWVAFLIASVLVSLPLTLLVAQNRGTLHRVCRAERAFISRQEVQTRALLSRGYTFGIPKAQIPALLQQSTESQAHFLHDLTCR